MGTGKTLIAFDAHIDTVVLVTRDNWNFDPMKAFEDETKIGGRGCIRPIRWYRIRCIRC